MDQALLMNRNIKLLYAFRSIRTFLVMMPIIVPFFLEQGLNQFDIYILQSLFATMIVLLEVPSGYYADFAGRRKSMIIGAIALTIGFVFYSLSYGFWPLLIGETILAVGYSFISGADSAIAYDSYAALNKEISYRGFEGKSNAAMGFSEAAASLLGGALAIISLRTPIVAEALVTSLLIPLSFFITEPERIKKVIKNPFLDILKVAKYALHDHGEVKWLILYGAVVATLTHTMVWLTQPYYNLVGVPLEYFGLVWALQLLAMSVFSWNADRYVNYIGRKKALLSFPIVGVATYLLLGFFPVIAMLPALLGFYFVRGVHIPVLKDLINNLVDSDVRATVLSAQNLVQKLLYSVLGPLVGVVTDTYSLQTALLFSAVLYGSLSALVIWKMKKHKVL